MAHQREPRKKLDTPGFLLDRQKYQQSREMFQNDIPSIIMLMISGAGETHAGKNKKRKEAYSRENQFYMPLVHIPGEAQVDFARADFLKTTPNVDCIH